MIANWYEIKCEKKPEKVEIILYKFIIYSNVGP